MDVEKENFTRRLSAGQSSLNNQKYRPSNQLAFSAAMCKAKASQQEHCMTEYHDKYQQSLLTEFVVAEGTRHLHTKRYDGLDGQYRK